jgi:hypothetical protein
MYIWADPELDSSVDTFNLEILTSNSPPYYKIILKLLNKPSEVQGGPDEGTVYDMSIDHNPNIRIQIPACRTSDGTQGYIFEYSATAVPEPSSLIALVSGVGGLAFCIRRRRIG